MNEKEEATAAVVAAAGFAAICKTVDISTNISPIPYHNHTLVQ